MNCSKITLREMAEIDATVISEAFSAQSWNKPVEQYHRYWHENQEGKRIILLAEWEGDFAGYVTILWDSGYPAFREARIPEIVDLNVLKKYRRKGIGTALLDEAERQIAERATTAGLGVCIQSDYGAAQILYSRRGYVPDGRGAYTRGKYVQNGDIVTVDDDLAIYMVKLLSA